MRLRKGQEITVDVDRLALEGRGVARHEDLVVFVDKALAGEQVVARVKRVKRKYVEARAVQILRASADRIPGRCTHLEDCGGCTWQDLQYAQQLEYKKKQIIDCLERIGGLKEVRVLDVVGSVELFYYRNKMEYSFSNKKWLIDTDMKDESATRNMNALGLHVPLVYDKVLNLDHWYFEFV